MWLMVLAVLVLIVVCYAVLPNILTRMLRVGAVSRGPDVPTVSLTFDDGPDERYTPKLLDVLRDVGVHATFFVIVDKALRHPDLIERMMAEGHDVQVHGQRHWFVPWLPPQAALRQVNGAAGALRQRFGLQTRFYRPTWGLCNLLSFLPWFRRNHRLVTWSVMVGDWRVTDAGELLRRILQKLHAGAIICLHDSDETFGAEPGAPTQVIQLIPELVRQVHDRGYTFRTMAEWL